MVDEPEVAFVHFEQLLRSLCSVRVAKPQERAATVRQIYICLWVLFVWARDAGNVEGPFRASELASLLAWNLIRGDVEKSTKTSIEIGVAFGQLIDLHFLIWDELLGRKVIPFVGKEHALSTAVGSSSPVDVNLKMFETMGRIAMRGLWHLWSKGGERLPTSREDWGSPEAADLAQKIVYLVRNNPILLTPIKDDQSVEIGLVLLFLTMMGSWSAAAGDLADNIIQRTTFAFRSNGRYPTIHGDYRSLLVHPRERTEDYRTAQTKGSTLYPLLSLWASTFGSGEGASYLERFASKHLAHCNMQFWLAGSDSEGQLYIGGDNHGACLSNVPVTEDGAAAMAVVEAECSASHRFEELSAIALDHWPIVAMACLHHRLPLPPDIWIGLLRDARSRRSGDADGGGQPQPETT